MLHVHVHVHVPAGTSVHAPAEVWGLGPCGRSIGNFPTHTTAVFEEPATIPMQPQWYVLWCFSPAHTDRECASGLYSSPVRTSTREYGVRTQSCPVSRWGAACAGSLFLGG